MSEKSSLRVIKIIDHFSLVINGGRSDNISVGDKIEVYLKGDVISDQWNQEDIGILDFVKATLVVVEAYEFFSVCKDIQEKRYYVPSASERALGKFRGTYEIEEVENPLNIKEEDITGRKTGDPIIELGDFARVKHSD